jgi:hypothetical protein
MTRPVMMLSGKDVEPYFNRQFSAPEHTCENQGQLRNVKESPK